jgi:hypothetical protein
MQGDFPQLEIERELVLPKGWLELSVAGDQKVSTNYRDEVGALKPRSNGTVWTYRQTWLRIEQGFSNRATLYAHIPMVRASLENDSGVYTQTRAMGDVHAGIRFQPQLGVQTKLAFELDLKTPSGLEWPSDFIGGSNNTTSFLTGTGVTNLGVDIHGRQVFNDTLALDARIGYTHKFPSVVGYVLETGGFGNGWLNPGNETRLQGSLICQVGPRLTLHGDLRHSTRLAHRTGTSGSSTIEVDLDTLTGTESQYFDAGGGLQLAVNTNLEIRAQALGQVSGTDTRTFAHLGLEELSPQPGVTSELEVVLRW